MKKSVVIVLLVFSLFMGILAISVGLGAAFPVINRIAKPFVCPDGNMEDQQHLTKPYPGKNVITATWSCTDSRGTVPLSNFRISMIAGSFYGLILFFLLFLKARSKMKKSQQSGS